VNSQSNLHNEILRFQDWANKAFPGERYGEWEMEYEKWGDLYRAANDVLNLRWEEWTPDQQKDLIFAIARDNEIELLAESLTREQVFALIPELLRSQEWEAKWQLAVRIGKLPYTERSEQLLLALANDPHEYVRRRTLGVLAEHRSPATERLAISAWETADEYARMACLHALDAISSPLLQQYLRAAYQDGRPHLLNTARQFGANRP